MAITTTTIVRSEQTWNLQVALMNKVQITGMSTVH